MLAVQGTTQNLMERLPRRLMVSGAFYDEFAVRAPHAEALLPGPAPPASAVPAETETLDAVLKRVQGAVLAVLGAAVGADVPLMEAGLDSLGEAGVDPKVPTAAMCWCNAVHFGNATNARQ